MESLTQTLLYKDIDDKTKKLKTRIKNYIKYDDQIAKFSYLLNIKGDLPILKNFEFNNKICFIDWLLRESVVYLSMNCVYLYDGKLAYIEALTSDGEYVTVNYDGNLRTFSGSRFKKQIDVSKIGRVNVLLVDKLLIRR